MKKQERFDYLFEMGCVICRMPPQIHHCRGHDFGTGMGLKAADRYTIPLCARHHTGDDGIHHVGVKLWERKYGTQKYWLSVVDDKIKSLQALYGN